MGRIYFVNKPASEETGYFTGPNGILRPNTPFLVFNMLSLSLWYQGEWKKVHYSFHNSLFWVAD